MPKPKFDKSKYSRAGKEQHPVKVVSTKRPITKPPAKDKAVLNSVRWVCAALGGGPGRGAREPHRPCPSPLGCGALPVLGASAERVSFCSRVW